MYAGVSLPEPVTKSCYLMLCAGSVFSFICCPLSGTNTWEAKKRDQAAFYHKGFLVLSSATTTVVGKDAPQDDVTGNTRRNKTLLLPASREL